jgi:integrase
MSRKSGADVWEYRYRDHSEAGSPMRQMTLSTLEYPTKADAELRVQALVLQINGAKKYRQQTVTTMGVVINRFMEEERIADILRQRPGMTTITDGISYSTAAGYRSYIKNHIEPKWARVPLAAVKPLEITHWLNSLDLSPKTRGQVRALMHLLFERAMLWELFDLQRNPVELVKLRGTSRRTRKPQILAPEKFQELLGVLPRTHRIMAIVAMCTGLRVSEILALRWEHIDFKKGAMLVQQGVVNGRIGRVKTEASQDEVPLDPAFAAVLQDWKGTKSEGLVFPSPLTGRPFYAGILQRNVLRPKGAEVGISGLGWHTFRHTYRSLLDETGATVGVQQKLMRHSNVSTTMNVYGNSTLRAKQQANSKVVQMVMRQESAQAEPQQMAV